VPKRTDCGTITHLRNGLPAVTGAGPFDRPPIAIRASGGRRLQHVLRTGPVNLRPPSPPSSCLKSPVASDILATYPPARPPPIRGGSSDECFSENQYASMCLRCRRGSAISPRTRPAGGIMRAFPTPRARGALSLSAPPGGEIPRERLDEPTDPPLHAGLSTARSSDSVQAFAVDRSVSEIAQEAFFQ